MSASNFCMTWPTSNLGPSPLKDPKGYVKHATSLLKPMIRPPTVSSHHANGASESNDVEHAHNDVALSRSSKNTVVYPLFQFAPLFPREAAVPIESADAAPLYSTELPALRLLLRSLRNQPFAPTRWTFTAGYFNMTPEIRELLLSSLSSPSSPRVINSPSTSNLVQRGPPQPQGQILTAHPHANGFYPSTGLSALLPLAYTHLASQFLDAVRKAGLSERVTLQEWKRGLVGTEGGWTYHAKGIWVTLPPNFLPPSSTSGAASGSSTTATEEEEGDKDTGPSITVIGSSNYTLRSHTLDTESNALIITSSPDLRRRLGEEEKWLAEWAGDKVDGPSGFEKIEGEGRRVRWWVKASLWIVGVVGGAL